MSNVLYQAFCDELNKLAFEVTKGDRSRAAKGVVGGAAAGLGLTALQHVKPHIADAVHSLMASHPGAADAVGGAAHAAKPALMAAGGGAALGAGVAVHRGRKLRPAEKFMAHLEHAKSEADTVKKELSR